jgi:hypothetical protein
VTPHLGTICWHVIVAVPAAADAARGGCAPGNPLSTGIRTAPRGFSRGRDGVACWMARLQSLLAGRPRRCVRRQQTQKARGSRAGLRDCARHVHSGLLFFFGRPTGVAY